MASLNWTPQSRNDLIAIAEFIAADSKKYAKIQIERIRNRSRQLIKYPTSGRIVPELEDETIRELIIGNYRLIYKIISADRIDILTVHHSARRLDV